ncbi:MAG: lysophospholipase [Clostridia bacterium]|nr:lysophospholipase [Clostridia bacterium]
MKLFNTKRKRRIFIPITVFLVILLISVIFCAIYLSDYYRADNAEIEAFMPNMTTEVYENGKICFGNSNSEVGFVFYPGGKVEYTAYIPLMRALATDGIFCVLYEMPFNLAVFDSDAAEDVSLEYPDIKSWYIGGHSLGGAMAASMISDNLDKFKGIVFLGAYSTADLSASDLRALSIYGSEDLVMDREAYDENKKNLPTDFTEFIIEGGCHAYFGMYGEQRGDGVATITPEQQITITAHCILEFIYE